MSIALFLLPLAITMQPPGLEASVRHLNALAAQNLPRTDDLWSHPVAEAVVITGRFPKAPSAWMARGRCEMWAARFPDAAASFQKAASLGSAEAKPFLTKARRYADVAASLKTWGSVNQLLDEGGGYWLAACTASGVGPRTLVEVRPSEKTVALANFELDGSNFLRFVFGFRDLDGDHRPELIVESISWLSNGGDYALRILRGSRGAWQTDLAKDGLLWDVPVGDLDRHGTYRLVIREWVWYKGPTWRRVCRYEHGHLRDVTRFYPAFLRQEVQRLRRKVAQLNRSDVERYRSEVRDARGVLRTYGYRL